MKQIKMLKSLYTKQSLLYTLNMYLEGKEFELTDDEKNYIISFENIDEENLAFLKQELNFNTLRFEIADNNKEIRKNIISQALGSINVD